MCLCIVYYEAAFDSMMKTVKSAENYPPEPNIQVAQFCLPG